MILNDKYLSLYIINTLYEKYNEKHYHLLSIKIGLDWTYNLGDPIILIIAGWFTLLLKFWEWDCSWICGCGCNWRE
jgi:hypothetical protein